ncbi:MAG: helix-turn-helix transcriptional regulator [Chlamydiia bacterium]|nr:helix-turn-helix transcriptional regulator [Chlamydiia bacterium]
MNLKEYLKSRSVTHKNFGKMIGVSQSYVTRIVLGNQNPSLALMQRIIEVTDGEVNVGDFFTPENPPKLKSEKGKKTENT